MPTAAVLRSSLVAAAAFLAACGGRPPTTASPVAPAQAPPHGADVAFMRGMLAHHAQALEMTALVPARTDNPSITRLAGRIEASQLTEMSRMRQWLETRNEPLASAETEAHGPGRHATMPGMLTADEMRRLAAASGTAFDRMFLESMIRHHEGALTMVAELFATESAGQEPELFRLASEVDADQRAEIARMRRLLTTIDQGSP